MYRVTHQSAQPQDQHPSDITAVEQVRNGDTAAFEALVLRYSGMLFGLSYRMLGDREDAADAVQEIFIRAFGALDSFDLSRPFHPWLYSIAVNHLRSVQRRRKRRPRPLSIDADRDNDGPPITPGDATQDPQETALMRLAERDAQRALDRLPRKYREVFVLRTVDELSVEDVARILKVAPGTVKTRLHRARRLLADALTKSERI